MLEPARGLPAAVRQARTTRTTAHRPWPLPRTPWVMGQTWERLLFAHWRVPAGALRSIMPPQIPLDEFDGSAWLGVTPFLVRGARPRLAPPAPVAGRFCELNVRTYATLDGRPGIWFFSLDAASALAVAGARRAYRLPYFHARSRLDVAGARVRFTSERTSADGPPAAFDAGYEPAGPVFGAEPGTLEHFLCERYCLYVVDDRGGVMRTEIHHAPWPLQTAVGDVHRNTMARPLGVELAGRPLLHTARRLDVVIWPPAPAG